MKYTVLSFCFSNYDILREPYITDPDAEYIFVSDKEIPSKQWKVVVDPKLADKDPIYASYYVRHHPFEYAKTDIVAVVDASIFIKDSLSIIIDAFNKSGADYSVMTTVYKNDEQKLNFWKKVKAHNPNRISDEDIDTLYRFIKRMKQEDWQGAIGQAFVLYRKTPMMQKFSKHVWRYLMALGHNGKPNRIDEIIIHKLLASYENKLSLFILSMQIIQSTFMTYCEHCGQTPIVKYKNYDQYFYLCNKPVYPLRFDKEILYPSSYRYKTEAMLLTKYLNPADLREWLDHHLNVCKFDHIHIFDNESKFDVYSICKEYGNKISYEFVEGQAYQYRLYDSYLECKSNAEWVIALDDDEYLEIGNFESVYEGIMYYRHKFPHMDMLAVRWKHMFPKTLHSERTGRVLDYCTEENPELAKKFMWLGDGAIKTFVRRYGKIHYEETWENPCGGHVPKNSVFYGALLPDGRNILGVGIEDCPYELDDERMRILHCRYKGFSDYIHKMKEEVTVSDSIPRKKKWAFDEILPTLT